MAAFSADFSYFSYNGSFGTAAAAAAGLSPGDSLQEKARLSNLLENAVS
jgi:hypothetical protein